MYIFLIKHYAVKAIVGWAMFFTGWSYFIELFLSFKMPFMVLKNLNYFLRYDQSKSSGIIESLWEGKTKTAKKDYFI